jgi:hypothetical protein
MTLRRATLYIGGASLLVAWFSSAASVSLERGRQQSPPGPPAAASPVDDLAADVQRQTRRLRQRLASAPLPQMPIRNPFEFRTVTRPQTAIRRVETVSVPVATSGPVEPALSLIGVAERQLPQGVVRTAMIATEGDELVMATVGDTVLQRYKVTAVSADAAELTDVSTGLTRLIALREQ